MWLSAYMQFAPYKLKNENWESSRKALGEAVIKTISAYSPNFAALRGRFAGDYAGRLANRIRFYRRPHFHGELALDQLFTMRPVLDWARYIKRPIRGLFLYGPARIPATDSTGASGANAAKENHSRAALTGTHATKVKWPA